MKLGILCALCCAVVATSGPGSAVEVEDLQGVWVVSTTHGDILVETKMYLRVTKGKLRADILSQVAGGAHQLAGSSAVSIEGDVLTWELPVPYVTEDGATVTVTVSEGAFEGTLTTSLGEIPITGVLTELPLPMQVDPADVAYLLGDWDVKALIGETESDGWVTIELWSGSLFGSLTSAIGTFTSDHVEYDKIGDTEGVIFLHVTIPGTTQTMNFRLEIKGDTFEGEEQNSNGMFKVRGTKVKVGDPGPSDEEETTENVNEAAAFIGRFDTNNDGKLQKAEAPERLQQSFMLVDQNGDGVLDEAEAAVIVAFMKNNPTHTE